jgi:hypothetical protein
MGAAAEAEKQKMAAEMAKVQAKQSSDQEKIMVQKILAGADTQLKAEQVELIAAQVIKTLAEAQNVGKEKKEKPNA